MTDFRFRKREALLEALNLRDWPAPALLTAPPELSQPAPARSPFKIDLNKPLPSLLREITADVERRYIRKALMRTRGNVLRCAKICGMSRRSITAKIAEYSINRHELRGD